jgi:hypothetical protein
MGLVFAGSRKLVENPPAYIDAIDALAASTASKQTDAAAVERRMQEVFGTDFKTTGRKAARDSPLQRVATKPAEPDAQSGVLSPKQWARQVHPESASQRLLPVTIIQQLRAEYKDYVDQAQGARALASRGREAESRIAANNALAASRNAPKPGDRLDQVRNNALEELLSGTPGPAYNAFQRVQAPSVGVTPRSGKFLQELIAGIPGIKGTGIAADIAKNPVAGWLRAYKVLTPYGRFGHPEDRVNIEAYLADEKPSPGDVVWAREDGRIDDEEKNELLHLLLSPEEVQRLLEPAQTAPKPRRALALPAYRKFDD